MKPSRPKEDREFDQLQRGLAASRLITDDLVLTWFEKEEARLVSEMVEAAVDDDQTRRDRAVQITLLRDLKKHLEVEATLGRKQQEKAKANG